MKPLTIKEIKAKYAAEVRGASAEEVKRHVQFRMMDRHRILEGMNSKKKDTK